jgi:microsomal dipeptidase-like Zn-dependent dipeptidase
VDIYTSPDLCGRLGRDVVPPERFPELTAALLAHQYSEADVAKILGGNMLRVAEQTWKAIEA